MATIFPLIGDVPTPKAGSVALPLAREFARDPATGKTVWRGPVPVIVTGIDAVLSWAFGALKTVRRRYAIYDKDFGCELELLFGHACSSEVKTVEAARMVRDALTVNPYITDVRDVDVDFNNGTLAISCVLITIYGEAAINV